MWPRCPSFLSEFNVVVVLSCLIQLSGVLQSVAGAATVCHSIIGFNSMVGRKQRPLTTAAERPDESLLALLRKGSCLRHVLRC